MKHIDTTKFIELCTHTELIYYNPNVLPQFQLPTAPAVGSQLALVAGKDKVGVLCCIGGGRSTGNPAMVTMVPSKYGDAMGW